ncbi:MAG: zeta toxin family protein [Magnetococcales bacterium]|nr:zeta toxin family protein [Magnetococcales bacterium]MBF0322181.1 zeta toxin family protein [Magnetococcales bacterium]
MKAQVVSPIGRGLTWGLADGRELPHIFVIAGPNGAGKSTTAPMLLRHHFGVFDYVNADTIAAGLSAFAPERAAMQAGRIMLRELHRLQAKHVDFAFETTLSTRSYLPWLVKCRNDGYQISLLFIALSSPEVATARVAERVRNGGHGIPEHVIRRRYCRGLGNFFTLYQPVLDRWFLVDNSLAALPTIVAYGGTGIAPAVLRADLYALLEERYAKR